MRRLFAILALLVACTSDKGTVRVVHDTVYVPEKSVVAPKPAKPALAVNPCDRPRPYKNWSNAELNAAQVEYMGTPQSPGLIAEAACRQ
jgi:hypothetical protein